LIPCKPQQKALFGAETSIHLDIKPRGHWAFDRHEIVTAAGLEPDVLM
jgi:hypothetical protein